MKVIYKNGIPREIELTKEEYNDYISNSFLKWASK